MREFINIVENTSDSVEDFMRDFESMTTHDADDGGRVLNDVIVYISKSKYSENSIYIEDMKTANKSEGRGGKALDAILSLADKHKINVEILAKSFGEGGPDTSKLISWYERHGFKVEWRGQQGSAWMVRHA